MSFVRTPNFAQPRRRVRSSSVSSVPGSSFLSKLTKHRRFSWPFFTSSSVPLYPIGSTPRPNVSPHRPALKRRSSRAPATIDVDLPTLVEDGDHNPGDTKEILFSHPNYIEPCVCEIVAREQYVHTPLACEVDFDSESDSDSSEESDDGEAVRCRKLRFDLTPKEARLNEEKAARKKSKQPLTIAQKGAPGVLHADSATEEGREPSWADLM